MIISNTCSGPCITLMKAGAWRKMSSIRLLAACTWRSSCSRSSLALRCAVMSREMTSRCGPRPAGPAVRVIITSHHLSVPLAVGQAALNCPAPPASATSSAAFRASWAGAGHSEIQGWPRSSEMSSISITLRPLQFIARMAPSVSSSFTQSGMASNNAQPKVIVSCDGMVSRGSCMGDFRAMPPFREGVKTICRKKFYLDGSKLALITHPACIWHARSSDRAGKARSFPLRVIKL